MKKKIDSLQLLRALAVSLVIFVHAAYSGIPKISSYNPTDSWYYVKNWGGIGVDLFFSISGFIMTVVIPSYIKPNGWKQFMAKRIIRIVPLYYLITAYEASKLLYKYHTIDIKLVLKSLFFLPFFDHKEFIVPLLGVGWTLSYEMYFYLLICILLCFNGNIYKRLLLVIGFFSMIGVLFNPTNALLRFIFSPILLEFAFGIVCGLIYKKYTPVISALSYKKSLVVIITVIGAALMSVTIFIFPNNNLNLQEVIENDNTIALYRSIIWGIPCAFFLMGVVLLENIYSIKIPRIIVLWGDASYSCYLLQAHLYSIIANFFAFSGFGPIAYLFAVVPLCLILSIPFYKYVEMPLTTYIDKAFHFRKPVIYS